MSGPRAARGWGARHLTLTSPRPQLQTSGGGGGGNVLEFPGAGSEGKSVPEMSRAGPGAAAVPEGGGGASAGGCQSPGLFLTRLLRLRAQVPARSCSPLRPGVSRPTKSLSRVPETRPGHRGSVQAPVVPQPSSQCVCPSLPAPRKPPQRAAGGPQPPAPPWGAPLASVGVPVPASAGRPASPSVGAAVLGVRSGRGAESGWWAQGRGINGLPRPGPRSERAWSPPQTNGGPGPPHLPRRPGLPRPRATGQAKKSWCGGAGVPRLGCSISGPVTNSRSLLLLARSPKVAVHGPAGPPWGPWEPGSVSSHVRVHTAIFWGPTAAPTALCSPFSPMGASATWPRGSGVGAALPGASSCLPALEQERGLLGGVLDVWPCPGCPVRRPVVHSTPPSMSLLVRRRRQPGTRAAWGLGRPCIASPPQRGPVPRLGPRPGPRPAPPSGAP